MKNSILVDVIWNDPVELSDKVDRINKIAAWPGVLTPQSATTVTLGKPAPAVTLGTPTPDVTLGTKVDLGLPTAPAERVPWFQMGQGEGKPGDLVEVPVYGGCLHKIDGFHVAGGCATQRLVAKSAKLSSYLGDYLKGQDPFIKFQYIERGLPESWWEFAIGFFSLAGRTMFPPITVPNGTELFRVTFLVKDDILPETAELVCADEYFYTHKVQRRRDLTYTYSPQGFTKVECISGKFTVL